MLFASSALVATTRAETMMCIADFIMAIIKMMRGEKVADALPFTKCGLCEEGGKHDGSMFSLRPVCNVSVRLRFVRWCQKIADERESLLHLLFSRRMASTPH